MTETIWGKGSFEERKAAHLEGLQDATAAAVVELAATFPGGSMDFPSAPIDPVLNAAAQELVREAGLGEAVQRLRQM